MNHAWLGQNKRPTRICHAKDWDSIRKVTENTTQNLQIVVQKQFPYSLREQFGTYQLGKQNDLASNPHSAANTVGWSKLVKHLKIYFLHM